MSCDIYFVRHGETYWNVERRMQGQVNIPLNERGREQARAAARKLRDVPREVCYTSPLDRAVETARIILGQRRIPIIDESLLIEQGYGLSKGTYQDHGYHDLVAPIYRYEDAPETYRPDIGAESFEDIMNRAATVVEKLLVPMEKKYRNVLITAHGAIICGILNTMLGRLVRKFWDTKLDNCGIAQVTFHGRTVDMNLSECIGVSRGKMDGTFKGIVI
ncbi:histidine phosphatase family protein [Enterocloster clostridioformis]|uniref:Phosphoglycerate mutase n=1 Tax=Enterocloster clostridioformis TaxID=1531 RepID=A0A2X2U3T3_9FIRM|nr:histidine phosphatase family protein [Enterocloster clostridioformis]MCA5578104.1 histidine phosphatase family protein [Enterocloster clostridioformis]SQB11198.1 phosphoglycerate mutase [Enterocloster clostridioformis]